MKLARIFQMNFKAALQTSNEEHISQLTAQNTLMQSWSSLDAELISALLSQGVFLEWGEGESKGNEVEATQAGGEQRENTKEVDYLLSLLQRHLQPAYFLLILLLHLVHLLVMSCDLFLQGSFQGCKLPLSPLQHILLLLLGQENLLQLQLQMHHVLLKSDSNS